MTDASDSPDTTIWSLRRESDDRRYALWDALADMGSEAMDASAVQFCMRRIASMIEAQGAFWGGTVRVGCDALNSDDPYKGWRLGAWVSMEHTQANQNRGQNTVFSNIRMIII